MAVFVIDEIEIKNNPDRPVVAAARAYTDTGEFTGGPLTSADDEVQKALVTLNNAISGGGITEQDVIALILAFG
jgi:hypothetical protein